MSTSNEFEMPRPDEPETAPTPPAGPEMDRPRTTDPRSSSVRTHNPPPSNSEPRRPSSSSPAPAVIAVVLALVVAGGLGAAWYLGYLPVGPRAQPEPKNQPAAVASADQKNEAPSEAKPGPEADVEPVTPPPSAARADTDQVSRKELDALSKRLDKLQDRIDQKPQSQVNLQSLESRLNELETLPDAVNTLTAKVKDIDDRLIIAETAVENLQSQVKTLKESQATAGPATPPVSPEDELQRGIGLFHNGRYRESREVFDRLTQSLAPDDARAWYYDALATGLSTGDWTQAAPRLAREGVKHEKAGSPSSDKIDQALDDLTEPTGRDWIAAYRNRIQD